MRWRVTQIIGDHEGPSATFEDRRESGHDLIAHANRIWERRMQNGDVYEIKPLAPVRRYRVDGSAVRKL